MIKKHIIPGLILGLISGLIPISSALGFTREIDDVAHQWATIKYQYDPHRQGAAYETLQSQADSLIEAYPYDAEPLIWSAIVSISYAATPESLQEQETRQRLLEQARDHLIRARNIDSRAVDGSALSLLGFLYYQMPELSPGGNSADRISEYLRSGILLSQNGLDAYYYYGSFLVNEQEYDQAVNVLESALSAPPATGNPVADQGRRQEVRELLEYARNKAS